MFLSKIINTPLSRESFPCKVEVEEELVLMTKSRNFVPSFSAMISAGPPLAALIMGIELIVKTVLNKPSAMLAHKPVISSSVVFGSFNVKYAFEISSENSSGSVTMKSRYWS